MSKRPELLLAAAALLAAAGVLLVLGARGTSQQEAPPALTTVVLQAAAPGANPFEPAQPPAQTTPPTQPVESYVVGYTGVAVYERQTAQAQKTQAAAQFPVNLNTATQAQLETIPGVGPVKAQAILAWRAVYGRFSDPAQLLEIKGIGEKTLLKILPFVTI